MSYSQIKHELWDDMHALSLSPEAFKLFIWSFTNGPGAGLTGMTEASERKLIRAVWGPTAEVSGEQLDGVLTELAGKPFCLYDYDHELLWCVRRMKHSLTGQGAMRAASRWLEHFPPSPLLGQARQLYPAAFGGA